MIERGTEDNSMSDDEKNWVTSRFVCPDCGATMVEHVTDYNGLVEVEVCCLECEFYDVFYE